MESMEEIEKRKHFWYWTVGGVTIALTLLLDALTPLGVAGGDPYVVLVLMALLTRQNWMIVLGATIGTVLTVLGYYISPPGAEPWVAWINRTQSIAMFWITAWLCMMQNRGAAQLQEANAVLDLRVKERTAELKAANERLQKETSYIRLNNDIAVSSNENRSLDDSMRYGLERICLETGWPVGHLYFPSKMEDRGLVPTPIWYLEDAGRFATFRAITEATPLRPGEGLPGRVLADGKPAWIMDVTRDANFPRAKLAQDIGVRAGFAFPIMIGEEVVGVMEFFSAQAVEPDARLLDIMGNIGTQLGRVIERKMAEDERDQAQKQLRQLYLRIEQVREEERTGIAREVHDELGQVLTTLKLDLALLDKKIPAEAHEAHGIVGLSKGLVDNTIQTVKRISLELRPPVLDVLGLQEAIEWQGREIQKRTGIQFDFAMRQRELVLDEQRATTLFRTFQETLTNIVRHADAKKIFASLVDNGEEIVLKVQDDGKGITPEQIDGRRSLGILGMRERVQVWGGEVDISGEPGEGTTVVIRIKR
jgi:signal transduction histidine kinase